MAATKDKYSRDTLNNITAAFNQLVADANAHIQFTSAGSYQNFSMGFECVAGHKYIVRLSNWTGITNIRMRYPEVGSTTTQDYIVTPSSSGSVTYQMLGPSGSKIDTYISITDLTSIYGAGNEPTIAQFEATYGTQFRPYTALGSTIKLIYALQPLALTEYASDADFQNYFFCHAVRKKKDSENKVVVLGLLNPNATTNSHYNKLHADKRKGRLKLTLGGVNYTVLNDGGINTLPLVDIPVIDLCAQNMVIFHFPYQNAYWENTSNAVARIEVWHNGSKDNQRTLTLSDMPKVRATSSDIDGPCYIFDQDTMNALSPSVGDTIKIHLAVTNGEGTFDTEDTYSTVASATVTPRVELFQIYKLTSISDNPVGGDIYHCLMLPEYWATKAGPGGQQVPLENGDEGYPNLVNLFAAAVNTRVNTTVYFRGFEGNSVPADLLDSALPAGLYYGFPSSTPFVSEDPPQNNKIIEVENVGDGGRAFKWYNSTYNPPTPVVPLTFTGFTIAFSTSGAYTSYATRTNNFYECHLWPLITATANGAGSGSFLVELVLREEGNDHNEVVVWSKYISIQFTSAGTKQIQLVANSETEGEEGVPIDKVGCIDTSFTSQGGMYEYSYRFQITEIDSSSSLSGVTLPVQTLEKNVENLLIS